MNVKEELIKSANKIRDKYRALKRGKFNIEEQRLEDFKPLLEPLNKLVANKEQSPLLPPPPPTPTLRALPPVTEETIVSPMAARYLPPTLHFGVIASKYLSRYFSNDKSVDMTYGLRSHNKHFYLGNKEVTILDNDITIGDKTYKGTDGLWKLITLKNPTHYTQEDLDNYKEILIITSAHKKRYEESQKMSANKGTKYLNIIRPLFTTIGEGLREVTGNKIDYVYWDDANELVDKLRLLVLSQRAGNSGVHNEIQSILEELMEAGIIYK